MSNDLVDESQVVWDDDNSSDGAPSSGAIDASQVVWDDEPQSNTLSGRLESMHKASTDTPEDVAKWDGLAKQAGVSYNVAKTIPDQVEKKLNPTDWDGFAADAPKTAQFLSDNPRVFEKAKGDIQALRDIETARTAGSFAHDLGIRAIQGVSLAGQSVIGTADMALKLSNPIKAAVDLALDRESGTLSGLLSDAGISFNQANEAADALVSDASKQDGADVNAAFDDGLVSGGKALVERPAFITEKVVQSAPQMLVAMAAVRQRASQILAEGGEAALKAAMPELAKLSAAIEGAQTAGNYAGEKAEDGDLTARESLAAAGQFVTTAAIGQLSNKIGGLFGINDVEAAVASGIKNNFSSVTDYLSKLGGTLIKEGPLEEGMQSATEQGWANFGDGQDLLQGTGRAFVEGSVVGAAQGGTLMTAKSGVDAVSNLLLKAQESADRTANDVNALDAQIDAIAKTKLAQLDKEDAVSVLNNMDGGESGYVYVDSALFHTGVVTKDVFLRAAPSAADQIDQAMETGGLIRMPRNELLVGLSQNADIRNDVMAHVKSDVFGDTQSELGARQSELDKELEEVANKAISMAKDKAKAADDLKDVVERFSKQFNETGYGTQQGNKKRAILWAVKAMVVAKQTGLSPMEAVDKYFGRLRNKGIGSPDNVFNQEKVADFTTLEKAKADVAAGIDPVQVQQETGWQKDDDGLWRFYEDAPEDVAPVASADISAPVQPESTTQEGGASVVGEPVEAQQQAPVVQQPKQKVAIGEAVPDDQVESVVKREAEKQNARLFQGGDDAVPYNTDAAPTELSDEAADDLVTLYQELGSDDDNFQYARKTGDDLDADIISALPEGTVQTADEAVIMSAQMDAEDAGAPDIVDVKKYSIPTKELLVDANDKPILKDGKKQYATQKRDAYVYINDAGEYWTDISNLKRAGGVGGIIYTKVADFAEKNGGVFRGDPLGLSDDALLKRTEHMASGIARRKDTGRFIPHERQLTLVDKDHATSPLNTRARAMKWVNGNDTINRREIVKTAFHNITQVMPELRHAWIDPDSGRILVRGTPLNTKFRDWVHELQKGGLSSDGQRRTDTAGAVAKQGEPLGAYRHLYASASIKRQLLANTLARYVGESAERRRQILDRLGEISKDLESYDGRKLFYQSKKTESAKESPNKKRIAKRDAEYMAAVERGDVDAAQKLVNEAAAEAGYDPSTSERMSHAAPNSMDGMSVNLADAVTRDENGNIVPLSKRFNARKEEEYFQDKDSPRGFFEPITRDITMLAKADLSTFLHETGHLFLEIQAELALEENATDRMKSDMDSVLKWFGVEGETAQERLKNWHAMPFEQKRPLHEKYAESFEQYLFEGKAPSAELEETFQTFRAWLSYVYTSIKNFLSESGQNADLNDEIRSVFDRMLATEEQIAQAQQTAGMMPMYASRPDGVSDAEWEAYQQAADEYVQAATEALSGRALRDLKWVKNAVGTKGKIMREMRREAAPLRREARMEATTRFLSQPIVQAYQFLTAPVEGVKARNKRARNSEHVDTARDSLFTAIAKLGGLNKEEAVSQYGIDPKDFLRKGGVFGKPVLRVDGGLSPDAMAEALSQHNYLPLDEHGKWDIRDLEDLLREEAAGNPQYSTDVDMDVLLGEPQRAFFDAENVEYMGGRLNRIDIRNMFDDIQLAEMAGIDPYTGEAVATESQQEGNNGASDGSNPNILRQNKKQKNKDPGAPRTLESMGVLSDDGILPELVAGYFGMETEQLIRGLLGTPELGDIKQAIENMTDQIMLERHADLATPEAMAEATLKAVMNKARAKFVATEYAILAKAAGGARATEKQAKEYAQRVIGETKVKDVKPEKFIAAAAKAGKEAQKAMAKSDTKAALLAKRNQVLNEATAKLAVDVKDEVKKFDDLAAKIIKATNEKNAKRGRDPDVVNAITAVMGFYGFYPSRQQNAMEYLERVREHDPDMFLRLQDAVNRAAVNQKDFNDLTINEMRGLREEIEGLWYTAKRSRQMEIDGKKIDMKEAADGLVTRLLEVGLPDEKLGAKNAPTEKDLLTHKLKTAGAWLTRVEQWAERMDGQWGGAFTRYIFQPVKKAADRYRTEATEYNRRYVALIDALPKMKRGLIAAPELGYTFGAGDQKVGMAELLHAVLHTGNASNKRKLLLGRGWAVLREDGTLDTARWDVFVERMHKQGVLKKEHYDFAQGVWDLLEDTKAGAQKTHRDVFGYYFAEVTADAFGTPFGIYRGGYVPAQADPRLVVDAAQRAMAEEENNTLVNAFPATAKGFTKGRTEYNKPLMLDLQSLSQHINKVLLFTHMEPAVRDVKKLLMRNDVAETLGAVDRAAYDSMLTPWLSVAARQSVNTPVTGDAGISNAVNIVRNNTGMALMAANLSNAMQQITGFLTATQKVKGKYILRETASFLARPKEYANEVRAASEYMAVRMDAEIHAINSQLNELLIAPTAYQKTKAFAARHAYFLQAMMDNTISPIIWRATFNQSVEKGMTDADAEQYANATIRQTQGSSLPEDVSRIEVGGAFWRATMQFYGYFNSMVNTNVVAVKNAKTKSEAMGHIIYGAILPAIVAQSIAVAMRGGVDDDDYDGWLDDWITEVAGTGLFRYATAMVPVVGAFANLAVGYTTKTPVDDRMQTSATTSMIGSALRSVDSVPDAITGNGKPSKAIKDVAAGISLFTGLPVFALARPVGYAADVAAGEVVPTSGGDMTRGLLTGTASPDSK